LGVDAGTMYDAFFEYVNDLGEDHEYYDAATLVALHRH
jgi:hypothetical protein